MNDSVAQDALRAAAQGIGDPLAIPGREGREPNGADVRAADGAEAWISPIGRTHRKAMLERRHRRWQGARVSTPGGFVGTVAAVSTDGVLHVERDDGWFLPYDIDEMTLLGESDG